MKTCPASRNHFARNIIAASLMAATVPAFADATLQTLPFSQDWSNTGLLTTAGNWSALPGIVGYRGDNMTSATGTNPQTIVADGNTTPVDALVNQTNPNTFATGGIAEFEIANPTIALNGSGTADAPHIVIHLNTSGQQNINVAYVLRDLDGSTDNAIQPVALQFRVGNAGPFTDVVAAFVADATSGPSLATLTTPVSVTLPAAFRGVREAQAPNVDLERAVRLLVGATLRKERVVSSMIDRIKELFDVHDDGGHA